MPYTGISLGWRWDDRPSNQRDVIVEKNHIHDAFNMLYDGGAIYTLGNSPGMIVQNNYIHDILNGNGVQHDAGSSFITIRNNVFVNVLNGCLSNPNHDLIWENNIIVSFRASGVSRSQRERYPDMKSHTFTKNIFYVDVPADTARVVEWHWNRASSARSGYTFENNLYWAINDITMKFAIVGTFADWQKAGNDLNSIVADPLFVSVEKRDFNLKPGSPAFKLGIKPVDISDVGPQYECISVL